MKPSTSLANSDVLQARLASRLTAALGERASMLPHDIVERLRFAREQALVHARASRLRAATVRATSAAPAMTLVLGPGGAALAGPPAWWLKMANVLPVLLLIAGLVLVEDLTMRTQVLAAADIDSVLLADDLPPAAYTDPGFVEFLKAPQP